MKIILIHGKSGVGKDTIANHMREQFYKKGNYSYIVPNAMGVKNIAKEIFNVNDEKTEFTRNFIDNLTTLGYVSDKYFWEKQTQKTIECELAEDIKYSDSIIIIPDFRFQSTYVYFKDVLGLDVYTINVHGEDNRRGVNQVPSKFDTNQLGVTYDYVILADGDLKDTLKQADSIVNSLED